MKQTKIALCGQLRSGKNLVANMLNEIEHFEEIAFAEGIWETIALLFPDQYDKVNKPRKLLQELGQGMRAIDADVWVKRLMQRAEKLKRHNIVVTDLRQPNEFKALREAGFFIIRIESSIEARIARAEANGDKFNYNDLLHETEKHVSGFDVDYVIENNGTIEDLRKSVEKAFQQATQNVAGVESS